MRAEFCITINVLLSKMRIHDKEEYIYIYILIKYIGNRMITERAEAAIICTSL